MRTVLSPENAVIPKFHTLKDVMMQFFEATPNLDNYLNYVTTIKLRSEDPELYPKDD